MTADDKITPEEVEECKNQSLLEKCMAELAADFPHFDELFVKERDIYMAYSLQNAAMPVADENGMPRAVRVVGVVGIGHAAGIKKHWGKVTRQQIERIMTIPEPQLSKRILKATIKYGFYGLICFGAYKIIRPRLPANLLWYCRGIRRVIVSVLFWSSGKYYIRSSFTGSAEGEILLYSVYVQ